MAGILFIADEHVPIKTLEVFRSRGHTVTRVPECLQAGVPDQVVARFADSHGGVVLTFDEDFKSIICRRPANNTLHLRNAGRVLFKCGYPQSTYRAAQIVYLIEWEYGHVRELDDKRIILEVHQHRVLVDR